MRLLRRDRHGVAHAQVIGPRRVIVDPPLDLMAEMADQALDRPRRRVAKRADGVAFHLRGDIEQLPISRLCARPSAMRVSTRHIQPVPSRQGVHWPQLSCL